MLRVKILINLQVGSVRVKNFAIPFVYVQRLYRRKIYLETIEGVDPVYQSDFSFWEVAEGFVRPELTFQLGTNAADTIGLKI